MKKWTILSLVSAAMFIIVIDTTIMNVSISALVVDLNTTVSGIQSAISIYALVMASFMLIGGKLADILGQKRVFVIGLVVYGVGTTTASLSQSLGTLIIGWSILEGLGAAMMLPNIQMLLRGAYEGKDRATAYGIIGAVGAIGAAVGPIVGGFLTTYASWRWAFRLELIIVIIVLVLRSNLPADHLPAKRPKFDYLGGVFSVVGWSAIVLGILMGQTYGFWFAKQPLVIGELELTPFGLSVVPFIVGFGLLMVMLLFSWERRLEAKQGEGLFKPSLLKISGLTSGFSVRFIQMGIMAGFLFTYPLLLQLSFEQTAIETGLALMPFSIALLITAMIGARLSSRFSAKRMIQVGFLLAIAGLLALEFTIQPGITVADLTSGILFGAGLGLVLPQTLNLVLSLVLAKDTPETAGLNGTFEQLGNAVGVALVGAMMLLALNAGLEQAINASTTISADNKAVLIEVMEEDVQLMSNTQLQTNMDAAGFDETMQVELQTLYEDALIQAFKSGVAFLLFLALAGIVLTVGLPNRKLVGEEVGEAGITAV
jgi:MFS family permease